MRNSLYPFAILGILLCTSCNKFKPAVEKSVEEHDANLKLLNQKLTEQQKFVEDAKRVLSEHRMHIQSLEKQVSQLTNALLHSAQKNKNQTQQKPNTNSGNNRRR